MKFSFWKHHPNSDQNGLLLASEAIAFQNKFEFDFLKSTPAGNWLSVCYGAKDELWENDLLGRRKITEFAIKNEKDFSKLTSFTLKEPLIAEVLNSLEICSNTVSVPVYATIFCPISQLIQISGLDLFLETEQNNPEQVKIALNQITENTVNVIKKIKKLGVKGLYFVTQHMQSDSISFELYNRIGKIYDEFCLKTAAEIGLDIIFHLHGNDCYSCIAPNIANLRLHCTFANEITPNHQTIKNSNYPIIYGIPASVLAEVKTMEDCENILKNYPQESLLTCECVLPLDFPDETIQIWKNYLTK